MWSSQQLIQPNIIWLVFTTAAMKQVFFYTKIPNMLLNITYACIKQPVFITYMKTKNKREILINILDLDNKLEFKKSWFAKFYHSFTERWKHYIIEQIYHADTCRLYALYIPLFYPCIQLMIKKTKLMRLKVSFFFVRCQRCRPSSTSQITTAYYSLLGNLLIYVQMKSGCILATCLTLHTIV